MYSSPLFPGCNQKVMQVTDKAVSTDDDLKPGVVDAPASQPPPRFDVTRLEAVLATLLENKVEAIKQVGIIFMKYRQSKFFQ